MENIGYDKIIKTEKIYPKKKRGDPV